MRFLILFVIIFGSGCALKLDDPCTTADGKDGKCILVRACPVIHEKLLQKQHSAEDLDFLEKSNCGRLNRKALVCCEQKTPTARDSLPQPPDCGLEFADRIFGGNITDVDQFGWTALIEYDKGPKGFGFHCGSSLISHRYVITAAHCISKIPASYKVSRIRLGEWDLASEKDCNENKYCNPPVKDVAVEKIIVHEEYRPDSLEQFHDIALIRLAEFIKYNEVLKPICLPSADKFKTLNLDGKKLFVVGWGRTETERQSRYKLYVGVNAVPQQTCVQIYGRDGVAVRPAQICAGGVKGEDSCQGDSGGPLMRNENPYYYLIGLVSYGPQACGTENIPGVYTRVSSYIDWIVSKMEP